jgi:transcriptional regulator with XRE-family HTH domain
VRSASDPKYIEFIARLRAARKAASLSQAELARRLGKPQSFVSKLETCERRIDLLEVLAICDALGIALDSIIPSEFRHLLRASVNG